MASREWRGQAFRYGLRENEDKNLDPRLPLARPRVPLNVEAHFARQAALLLAEATEISTSTEYVFPQERTEKLSEAAD